MSPVVIYRLNPGSTNQGLPASKAATRPLALPAQAQGPVMSFTRPLSRSYPTPLYRLEQGVHLVKRPASRDPPAKARGPVRGRNRAPPQSTG